MKTESEIRAYLPQFHGSETFTKWSSLFPNDVLTEGTTWLAGAAECFWLMDAIASHQMSGKVRTQDFQVWELHKLSQRHDDPRWTLTATDGNEGVIATQMIPYSDFPLSKLTLFACRNELGGITIMLPSEY